MQRSSWLKSIAFLTPMIFLLGASSASAEEIIRGVTGTMTPDSKSDLLPAQPLSNAKREALMRSIEAVREAMVVRSVGGAQGLDTKSRPTVEMAESEGNFIRRNNRNTRASQVSSTLAEPAAANDFNEVFYGGNTYFSRSADSGLTWTAETIPGGPAEAPFACCDLDAVHHPGLDTTFHLVMYVNGANPPTNGIIRIFVRRSTIAGGADCSYTLDLGGTTNLVPDYPHLAVSNNFLYLTTNNLQNGNNWTGAQIRRMNATQMANCQTAARTIFNYVGTDGQRVLTPVENATTTMYFGLNRSSNTFRILRLAESASSLSQFDRSLSHGSNFVNPDCRGGVGNFDFIERGTAFSITGFRLRGAVVPGNRMWFLWNTAQDGSHPKAHLHSAIFSEPGLTTLASPAVFASDSRCFGFPAISANSSGEFGVSFAHGGRVGGGGFAAQGAIMVDDANSAGNSFSFFSTTASGTHNRTDSRFGDYFTVRKNDRCSRGWVATNYALLNGNSSSAHVNARYVEFQSSLAAACP